MSFICRRKRSDMWERLCSQSSTCEILVTKQQLQNVRTKPDSWIVSELSRNPSWRPELLVVSAVARFYQPFTVKRSLVFLQTHLQLFNLRLGSLLCFPDRTPPVTLKTQRLVSRSHLESPERTRTHPTHVRDTRRVDHVELRTVVFVIRTQDEAERSKHVGGLEIIDYKHFCTVPERTTGLFKRAEEHPPAAERPHCAVQRVRMHIHGHSVR